MKSDLRNNTNKIRIITYFFQHFKFVISNQDDRVSMKKYKTLLVSPPLFLFLISDRNSLAYWFRKSSKQSRDNLASDFKKKKKQQLCYDYGNMCAFSLAEWKTLPDSTFNWAVGDSSC